MSRFCLRDEKRNIPDPVLVSFWSFFAFIAFNIVFEKPPWGKSIKYVCMYIALKPCQFSFLFSTNTVCGFVGSPVSDCHNSVT